MPHVIANLVSSSEWKKFEEIEKNRGDYRDRELSEGQEDYKFIEDFMRDSWTFRQYEILIHLISDQFSSNPRLSLKWFSMSFLSFPGNFPHIKSILVIRIHEFVIWMWSELIRLPFPLIIIHLHDNKQQQSLRINREKCRWDNVRDLWVLMLSSWRIFYFPKHKNAIRNGTD